MGEDERDEANAADDQETSNAERSNADRDGAPKRSVEKAHGTSVAPVDDDVIIK